MMKNILISAIVFMFVSITSAQTIKQEKGFTSAYYSVKTISGEVVDVKVPNNIRLPNDIRPGDMISGTVASERSANINKPNISGPAGLKVNTFSGGLYYQRTDLQILANHCCGGHSGHIPDYCALMALPTRDDDPDGCDDCQSGSYFYQRTDLHIYDCGGHDGHLGDYIAYLTLQSANIRRPSIDLTFFYNSATTGEDIGFGPGWSMTYSMDVKIEGQNVAVRRADGRKDIYTFNGSVYVPPVGIFDSLVQYLPGKFKLRTKHGTNFFFEDSTHHRLTKITDPNSNTLTVGYTGSLPTTITDPSGRIVTLAYSGGHLTQVTDANFSPARTITYQYDANNNPISVTDPLSNSIQYEYDSIRNMTKLIDQLSNQYTISYLNCIYVSNITSPLNSINISYDSPQLKTTVTEMVNAVLQTTFYKYNPLVILLNTGS